MLALFRLGVNRNVCDFSTFDFSALFYQWRCLIVTLRAFRDFLIFTLSIQTDVTWIYSHITLVRTRKVRAWPAALWFWPIVYSSSTRITPVYRDIAYLLLKSLSIFIGLLSYFYWLGLLTCSDSGGGIFVSYCLGLLWFGVVPALPAPTVVVVYLLSLFGST